MVKLLSSVIFVLILTNYCVNVDSFFCEQIVKTFRLNLIGRILNIFNVKDVNFYFYSNKSKNPTLMSEYTENLRKLDFNPNRKTIIIIHGFISNRDTPWVQNLVRKLRQWPMNIIVVDWLNVFLKNKLNYAEAALNTSGVAFSISMLLRKLAIAFNLDLKEWKYIHLIGHSLGAHVAGQAAKEISNIVKVHRITAFDPARPNFDGVNDDLRLNKTYAKFVDVIHTNSHPHEKTLGFHKPLGHIDFYPNGGDKQPRCTVIQSRTFTEGPISRCASFIVFGIDASGLYSNFVRRRNELNDDMLCDHSKGQEYFLQTIDGTSKFEACKANFSKIHTLQSSKCQNTNCKNQLCVEMGWKASKYAETKYHGTYYVDISNYKPKY